MNESFSKRQHKDKPLFHAILSFELGTQTPKRTQTKTSRRKLSNSVTELDQPSAWPLPQQKLQHRAAPEGRGQQPGQEDKEQQPTTQATNQPRNQPTKQAIRTIIGFHPVFQPQLNYICTCRKSSYLKPQREEKKQLLELQQLGPISKATIRRTLRKRVLRFAFTTILFPQPLAFLCRCQTHPQQPAPSPHPQRIPWLNVPGPDTVVPNGWSNVATNVRKMR